MKGFFLSLQSEFYKTRKTLGFWSAVILPVLICLLMFIGFYTNSAKLASNPPLLLWMRFANGIINVMGTLLLPMFIIFVGYSVNAVEHKADTWKSLFSLPISKWSVYAAKYTYAFILVFISLLLFVLLTIGFGNLLGVLKPTELKFTEYHVEAVLFKIYFKLFMSSLGILSIQFLLSLLWADFLKPMGIGFVGTIAGIIAAVAGWKYAYLVPYAHPQLAIFSMFPRPEKGKAPAMTDEIPVDIFTKEIYVGLIVAVVVFILGYFIVLKKSVK